MKKKINKQLKEKKSYLLKQLITIEKLNLKGNQYV